MLTLVALVVVQLNVEESPAVMLVGSAVNMIVGWPGGAAVTVMVAVAVAVPPVPLAVAV